MNRYLTEEDTEDYFRQYDELENGKRRRNRRRDRFDSANWTKDSAENSDALTRYLEKIATGGAARNNKQEGRFEKEIRADQFEKERGKRGARWKKEKVGDKSVEHGFWSRLFDQDISDSESESSDSSEDESDRHSYADEPSFRSKEPPSVQQLLQHLPPRPSEPPSRETFCAPPVSNECGECCCNSVIRDCRSISVCIEPVSGDVPGAYAPPRVRLRSRSCSRRRRRRSSSSCKSKSKSTLKISGSPSASPFCNPGPKPRSILRKNKCRRRSATPRKRRNRSCSKSGRSSVKRSKARSKRRVSKKEASELCEIAAMLAKAYKTCEGRKKLEKIVKVLNEAPMGGEDGKK